MSDPSVDEIRQDLTYARRKLREAYRLAQSVSFTDDDRMLLLDTVDGVATVVDQIAAAIMSGAASSGR